MGAVIEARVAERRAWLQRWQEEEPEPARRIERFVELVLTNREQIQNHGCPVGTLTTELAKQEHPMLGEATCVFTVFRTWLAEQFTLLGHREQADELALHVLAFSQGVAVLANAFRDERFVQREVGRIRGWLSSYTT